MERHISVWNKQKISRVFFLFDTQQLDYFLNLVQCERASTPSLRQHFQNRLAEIRDDRLNLKKRFDIKASLTAEQQATYYSSWIFPAVHVAVSIKKLQTPAALAEEFALPLRTIRIALQFLENVKLVELRAGRYVIGPTRIHLGHDSPMIGQSHLIWRTRASELFNQRNTSGFHYSSVVTLSESDAEKIHKMLVECIEKAKSVVRDSPEEEVRTFCVDFFKPS